MTWEEFKLAVEQQGVMDSDEICSIDYEPLHTFGSLECIKTHEGQWLIQNEQY